MAVDRVFNIQELLETILLQLSTLEILAVKPVSRSWKRLIEGSIALQRATFHAPNPRIMQRLAEPISKHLSTMLSLRAAPMLQGELFEPIPLFITRDPPDRPVQNKPWIYQTKPTYMPGKQHHLFVWVNDIKIGRGLSPALRSMFITQPPVTTILLFIHHRALGTLSPSPTLHIPGGITLGAVVDTFAQMMDCIPPAELKSMCKMSPPAFGGTFLTSINSATQMKT